MTKLLAALALLTASASCGCESPTAPSFYICEVLRDRCVPMTGLPDGMAGGVCTLRIERVVQRTPCATEQPR
jgi:hypothetical protein